MGLDRVTAVLDEGLGNQSYLVDLGDGRALAVDPPLDVRAVDAAAERRGLRIAYAAETHLHADFLSGAVRLARRDGARAVGSAVGARRFDHLPMEDDQDLGLLGGPADTSLVLRGWATPGHTDEHMSYLLLEDGRPRAVFTGGSLIVGAAARTDLVSPASTESLARAQFHSLRRLADLPDDTIVFPTHGAGSFCAAPPGGDRISTIGREKISNPFMRYDDEDAFVEALLESLGTYPPYFNRLPARNRDGVADPGPAALAPLTVRDVLQLRAGGADVVDVRPVADYATAHIPGSLAITLRGVFATWLGWLVADPATPLVIVRNPDQDPEEIIWQARKVGYDRIVGELTGGVTAWIAAAQPTSSMLIADPASVDPTHLLDVRQSREYGSGHVPGARSVELGRLADPAAPADLALPPGPLVTMCGHGERAATGASLLERAGRTDVSILAVGPADWAASTAQTVEVGA